MKPLVDETEGLLSAQWLIAVGRNSL
jgi:hypothetical protein